MHKAKSGVIGGIPTPMSMQHIHNSHGVEAPQVSSNEAGKQNGRGCYSALKRKEMLTHCG